MTHDLEDVVLPPDLLLLEGEGFTNPRTSSGLDEESIGELAIDIERRGLIQPLIVWINPTLDEPSYIVLDGQRRLLAIRVLLESLPGVHHPIAEGIPCRLVRAATLDEARTVALRTGLHRRDISSYEIAIALSKLEGTGEERAEKIGRDPSYVSILLTCLKAPAPVLEQWKAGEIGHKDAYAAAKNARAEARAPGKAHDAPVEKVALLKRPTVPEMRARLPELYAERATRSLPRESALKLDGVIAALEWAVLGKPL